MDLPLVCNFIEKLLTFLSNLKSLSTIFLQWLCTSVIIFHND